MKPFFPLLAAITAAPEKIPDLKPPRGEIPATLWEQHGWALSFLAAIVLILLIALVHRLRQPKPVAVPAPAEIARQQLNALRGHENGAWVNTEAARILRGFLIARFGLAGPGLTAGEIAANLPANEALAGELYRFLHGCEVADFAPAFPAPAGDAVIDGALKLIDVVGGRLPPPLPVAPLPGSAS